MTQQTDKRFGEAIGEYLEVQYELTKLKAADKIAGGAAISIGVIVILLFASLFVLSLSIAGGYYFSEITGSPALGFLLLSGIHLILLLIIIITRRNILVNPLKNDILKSILG